MPAERTKSWSYQDSDMYSSQLVSWQAPVASFVEPTMGAKIVELAEDDDDLPPLVDGPPPLVDTPPHYPLSAYAPPPPATFTFVSGPEDDEVAPPTRKRSASHSKKRPENHIPRPPNAFILFRSSFIKAQHVSTSIETNHSTLSKIIGMTWKSMDEGDKAKWHAEAKKELEKHKRTFPKYAFKPQQAKGKGAGTGKRGSGDGGGGGTAKRRVREVEPKDDKRCAKIAELLLLGLKGAELKSKMEEFDRTHVPEIITRFEAPITESHFQPEDPTTNFRRGSSAPIEETELQIEQASFLPKTKATSTRKARRSHSEKPTRASTPAVKATTPAPMPVHIQQQHQHQQQAPAFDFTNFSFDAAPSPLSMSTSYPAPIDPVFPNDLSIDTNVSGTTMPSFTDMLNQQQDCWSACSSPVSPMSPSPLSPMSPSPSFSMPSTPGFEAQSPEAFSVQMDANVGMFGEKAMRFDYSQFEYHHQQHGQQQHGQQQQEGYMGEPFIGMDGGYGFGAGMGMGEHGFGMGYGGYEVPQYAF